MKYYVLDVSLHSDVQRFNIWKYYNTVENWKLVNSFPDYSVV